MNYLFHGGIAQLGERLHGMQEVMGSNPTISIFDMAAALDLYGVAVFQFWGKVVRGW